MVAPGKRQRAARATVWVVAGLVVAFGLLLVYQIFFGSYFDTDPELMAGLKNERFPEAKADPDRADDWPQWRGPNRDGVSAERDLLTDWPARGPRVRWRKDAAAGQSSVAVVRGRVYTMLRSGDEEAVVCWDADTGKQVWRYRYPGKYAGRGFVEGYGPGPRSTPTVDRGMVFTVGATGLMHCLTADTGKKVWAVDLLDRFHAPNLQYGIAFSPLVEGDLVFTSPGGPDGNALAALDRKTGKTVWHREDDPGAYSSPVAATMEGVPQVIFFTRTGLVSVAPGTGEVYWRFPWETQYGCNIATPITVGNYVFISSNYGKGCALVKVSKDGRGKLQARQVYAGSEMANHYASSVRYRDHLYGFNDSRLTCLNLRTGQTAWKQGGFKKGSLMIADGRLIVLGEYGNLAVARASPDGFKPEATFQVTRNKCWTMPVFAEGKLFVRDEEQVICLDVRDRTVAQKAAPVSPKKAAKESGPSRK